VGLGLALVLSVRRLLVECNNLDVALWVLSWPDDDCDLHCAVVLFEHLGDSISRALGSGLFLGLDDLYSVLGCALDGWCWFRFVFHFITFSFSGY